jgi:hypothetical protein
LNPRMAHDIVREVMTSDEIRTPRYWPGADGLDIHEVRPMMVFTPPSSSVAAKLRTGLVLLSFSVAGCGSDDGGVDIEASKKIAAERGIGPGVQNANSGGAAKKAKPRPNAGLVAPPAKKGR